MRIVGEGLDPSYELLELDTGEKVPLAKPSRIGFADDWESYGNSRFVFSRKGFSSASAAPHF